MTSFAAEVILSEGSGLRLPGDCAGGAEAGPGSSREPALGRGLQTTPQREPASARAALPFFALLSAHLRDDPFCYTLIANGVSEDRFVDLIEECLP